MVFCSICFKRGFLDGWAGFVIALGNFEDLLPLRESWKCKGAQWQPLRRQS